MNHLIKQAYLLGAEHAIKEAGFTSWLHDAANRTADWASRRMVSKDLSRELSRLNLEESRLLYDNILARKFLRGDPAIPTFTGVDLIDKNPIAALVGAGALGAGIGGAGSYYANKPEESFFSRIIG